MSTAAITETGQYLTFGLDGESFALSISKVREVLEFTNITKVPRTPEYMRGVINLRGNVVPVVDLKMKLGLGVTQKSIDTCVIITELDVDGERTVLGALADSVQEVLELDPGQIAPPPRMGTRVDTQCILGMGKRDEAFVIILDIDHVLTAAELRVATEASAAGGGYAASAHAAA